MRAFDGAVDSAFDRLRGRPLPDRVFYAASALGDHSLIWLILAGIRAIRPGRQGLAAARAAAGIGAESALVNLGIKSLFGRVRPAYANIGPLHLRRPRTSSFPSGHASAAFCAATLLGDQDPARPLYYAAAVVVATSRIYVRIHHASDVVVGVAVGVLLGRFIRRRFPLPPPSAAADTPAGVAGPQ
ncbi:MAG TPA: phosphatase PAP2 family protein [Acidimicrobiales bacterium]|nr:phosphatase PAP2 family protein [Acidimicrobiales bacterium]